jgi:membrane protease YdiL (CAAX protease family)
MLAYFESLVGPAGAVLASSLLFGLDHAYQGAAGILKTGAWGLLYAVAYVTTGSLLAPMLLHFVTDAASGVLAYLALRPVT